MTQPAPTFPTPAPAPQPPALCTFDKGCREPAVFSFMWPWGEACTCCSLHRIHVQQRSDSLERGPINFTVLDPHKPVSLARDERTQLRASIMSLEDELRDAKARGQEFYVMNTQLADEIRRLRARAAELESQVKDRTAERDQAMLERDNALADASDANTEVSRLKALMPAPAPSLSSWRPSL